MRVVLVLCLLISGIAVPVTSPAISDRLVGQSVWALPSIATVVPPAEGEGCWASELPNRVDGRWCGETEDRPVMV